MKKIICLLLGLLFSFASYCQHVINGYVCDTEGNPLPGVNVLLYAEKDTTKYERGGATTAEGLYQLSDVKDGKYRLLASMLGFEPMKKALEISGSSVFLDTLKMVVAVESLEEIVVTSNTIHVLGDKNVKIFTPDERKRASSALDLMKNIPQISFNNANNMLVNIKGKQILILCDGAKANEVDLMGLRPENIQKAEYYANPPQKYMDSGYDAVLFVITKPSKEKGGYISADLKNSFTTGFGTNIIQGNYSAGDNDYMLRYFIDYRDLNKNKYSQSYSYRLNTDEVYDLEKKGENGDYVGQYHIVSASYSRSKADNFLFRAMTNLSVNPGKEDYPQLLSGIRNNQPIVDELSNLYVKTNYLSPNLDLYFSKKMRSDQEVSLNVVNTYFDSRSDRLLGFEKDGIATNLRSKSYSLIAEGEYRKKFSENELSAGAKYFYKTLDEWYRQSGNDYSKDSYSYHNLYMYADFTGQLNKFSYTIGFGGEQDWLRTNTYFVCKPNLRVSYTFDDYSSLKLRSSMHSYIPDISLLTNNPVYMDSSFISVGNPDLKPYYKLENSLLYAYNRSNVYAEATIGYSYLHKPYFPVFEVDHEMAQKVYKNIERMDVYTAEFYLSWKLTSFLKASAYYQLAYRKSQIESKKYDHLDHLINLDVSAYYKDFTLNGLVILRNKKLNGMVLEKTHNYYSVDLTWKRNDLGLSLVCLFMHDPYIMQTANGSPVFYKETKAWNNYKGMTYIKLTYTLPFGKKVKRSMKQRLYNSDNDSGIYIDNKTKL